MQIAFYSRPFYFRNIGDDDRFANKNTANMSTMHIWNINLGKKGMSRI